MDGTMKNGAEAPLKVAIRACMAHAQNHRSVQRYRSKARGPDQGSRARAAPPRRLRPPSRMAQPF